MIRYIATIPYTIKGVSRMFDIHYNTDSEQILIKENGETIADILSPPFSDKDIISVANNYFWGWDHAG